MKKLKKIVYPVLTLSMVLSLAACGGTDTGASASPSESAAPSEAAEKETVYHAALSGATRPFNYYDDSNTLTGFEIDILKEIDARLDDVSFDYTTTEFQSLFAGLDGGQFDLILNNITDKPERREKYLFSENAYYYNHTVIATREDTTNIQTLDDLAGVTIPVGPGTATDLFLKSYNEANPDKQIVVEYVEGDAAPNILALYEGRYDAVIYSESYLDAVQKEYGYTFNRYSIPQEAEIQNPAVYILFRQGDTDLQGKIDSAISAMKDDGTLSELSIKYFGKDATQPLEN